MNIKAQRGGNRQAPVRLVCAALAVGLLGGCQNTPQFEQPAPASVPGPSPLQQALEKREDLPVKPPRGVEKPPTGPLQLSREEAVLTTLRNNRSLAIQQLTPQVRGAFETIERARYDTTLFADAQIGKEKQQFFFPGIGNTGAAIEGQKGEVSGGVRKSFLTGTQVELEVSNTRQLSETEDPSAIFGFPIPALLGTDTSPSDQHQFRTGLTITQALLRGGSVQANLARIRQAEMDALASAYELRGFTQTLVAQTERLYWDYYLARRRIEIVEDSLVLAEQQRNEIQQRVRVGQLSQTELPAARAEVARRRQQLIDARSALDQLRWRMLQTLNPAGVEGWARQIELLDTPTTPPALDSDVEDHVQLALRHRPDINQARLQLESGQLQVVQTRNGLLPQLNLFLRMGKSGYAASFDDAIDNWDGSPGESYWDAGAGLNLEYPYGNRAAKARHRQAVLTREQRALGLQNMEQLASVDVRSAYREVERAQEQVEASRATRQLQEEALRAETVNFRVGRSTATLVARAQRDLVSAQVQEVQAIVDLRKALIDLYRQDGTLLQRRGIQVVGADPVSQVAPDGRTFNP